MLVHQRVLDLIGLLNFGESWGQWAVLAPTARHGDPLLRNIQEDREVRIGRLGRLDGLAKYPQGRHGQKLDYPSVTSVTHRAMENGPVDS